MKERITGFALVTVVFCIGLASGLFLLPFWVQPFLAAVERGNPSDWIGFAGNFGAGIMTLIAAIVAWFAVQRQIRAPELVKERQEAEAKFAARIVLTQTVHAAAAALNVADQLIDAIDKKAPRAEIANKEHMFKQVMLALKATMDHFAIAQAWQTLAVEDKTNYLIVTSTLHTVMTLHEYPTPGSTELSYQNRRDALSKLAAYLRAFDTELADVFDRDSKI